MKPYFERDWITIYHADCADVLPTIDPADVDLLLTDPPYGINIETDSSNRSRRALGKTWPTVEGDGASFDPTPLLQFKRLVLWGANNYASRLPDSSSWIVWNRDSGGSNTADAELAWTNCGGTIRQFLRPISGTEY